MMNYKTNKKLTLKENIRKDAIFQNEKRMEGYGAHLRPK